MTTKLRQIYAEVETRLDGVDGYVLVKGRLVDAQSDELPALAFRPHPKKGIQSTEEPGGYARGKAINVLYLTIDAVFEVQTEGEALLEAEDAYEDVRSAIFPSSDLNLGGLASGDIALDERHPHLPDHGDAVAMMQITFAIPYVETRQ